jgi:hypothetical protein
MRAFLLATFVLLLPLAAGCGTDTAGPAGAEIAPASAELFVSVRTDFDSEEWHQAAALVERFPDSDQAIESVLDELGLSGADLEADVAPALGPETDLVAFDLAGEGEAVGLTQPEDPAKLRELLAELDENFVTREIAGWTAFSDSEAALDRFESERADGTLADSERYSTTIAEIDTGALLQVYLHGESLEAPFPGGTVPTLGLSLAAEKDGARLEGVADLGEEGEDILPETFAAELPETVPGGALFYLGASDLEASLSGLRDFLAETAPEFERDLARVEAQIGVSLEEDVFPLFRGETALYARPGLFIPEVTLVTEVEDEAAATATIDDLVGALGEFLPAAQDTREVDIEGVTATEVPLGAPISLYYAAFDGRLIVTTAREGIASLRGEGDRLADDADFSAALDQADVPDETSGFAYVDLEEAIRYVIGLAEQAGDTVPPVARANLEPLQRLVLYAEKDGSTLRFSGFLAVN